MNDKPLPPSRAVELFRLGTTLALVALTLLTVLIAPLSIVTATGRGTLTVDATLDEPLILELFDGRRVSINPDGISLFENFPIGEENATIDDIPSPAVTVEVQREDLDTRILATISVFLFLAATWIGLLSLRRVAQDAVAGTPFSDANPRRLRWVGWSLLAILVIDFVRVRWITSTIESTIDVVVAPSTSIWVLLTSAIGFFALAWIFAEAGRLRRFEEATI